MSNKFLKAIDFTLPWEAGRDRNGKVRQDGGLNYLDGEVTKWGIYQKANPDIDVANLTLEDALKIYKERYWDIYAKVKNRPVVLEELPVYYAVTIFDTGVNCGVNRCNAWRIRADETKDPTKTLLGLRDAHYTNLKASNSHYAKVYPGWINRLNDLKKYVAILMVETS